MSESPQFSTSEAGSVQLQTLHLLANLGWRYKTRADCEGERRGRLASTLLEDVLAERLHAINRIEQRGRRWPVTDAAVQEAIGKLQAALGDTSKGAQAANEAATDLMQLGTAIPITIEGETKSRQLGFIDWQNPENNLFHMTAEFPVERSRSAETRRPDIVLFINGIPVAVIELKKSADGADQGISQTIRNQGADEVPRLFASVQVLLAANPSDPRYATPGTPKQFWSKWREKEISERRIGEIVNAPLDPGEASAIFVDFSPHRRRHEGLMDSADGRLPTPLDITLVALFSKARLIDLIRAYTLFDGGIKKIARYQQYFGVKAALLRLSHYDDHARRKGGVIWHTQGSGKSLTMVMLAREIANLIEDPRIVLVTDRRDLDRQIRDTFKATRLHDVRQATTGRHLLDLVEEKAGIVTTLIHKFKSGLRSREVIDQSRDVFLLVDESHRSQTIKDDESLHRQMRKVFPNACYIGFTGTPLLKKERSTFDRFGGLIHAYRIDEAVEDEAVVPLLYEGRLVETDVDEKSLDRWFERHTKGLSAQEITELKRKFSRGREVLGAEPYLVEIAADVSEDFSWNWKATPYKGQLVAQSRRAAVILKKLLDNFGDVTSEVVISPGDDRDNYEQVNEEPSDEVDRFVKQVKANHGSVERYEELVIERFKNGGEPDILIVVDKLLTGFDAPRNRVLYLTRKLKEHGLLQAIARVNRLYEDDTGEKKDFGHIIDYAGILGELDKALTQYSAFEGYDEADVADALHAIRKQTESLPDKHAALLDLFKSIRNRHDQEAFEASLADDLRRQDFYDRLREFAKALQLAFSSESFSQDTSQRVIDGYKADLKRFENLRRAVSRRFADRLDDAKSKELDAKIKALLDRHITTDGITPIVAAVNIFDETGFRQVVLEETGSLASKADAIASATSKSITEKMEDDRVFYQRFSQMIRKTIEAFRAGRLSEQDYFQRVQDIRNGVVNRNAAEDVPDRLRGNETGSSIYRNLVEDFAGISSPEEASGFAEETAAAFDKIMRQHRKIGWQDDPDTLNEIRNAMDDFLYDEIKSTRGLYGLDADAMDAMIDKALVIGRRQLKF
ncbi:HsdR family type I site-specific deoxyribonuclease [Martelella lutilitoris]|uniref:Type I restriction enzyme endonuclease subunit n=1 Tax=Martelella lutilitoris TaxID=2583532 RepID=A0A5C4JYK2_9HYPH|nr:HsdR family type I site-specific deoxyribonuclease [Martelella lutilitoris]TNB49689.1 HsdR family type I site-specific deoxyribonuclease [Martelella lutilitoris]